MSYSEGHVKRNPDNGDVAVRTRFPEDVPELAELAWLVSSIVGAPRNAKSVEVESWDDIYTPEASE